MNKYLSSLLMVLSLLFFYSCSEDSIQEKLEKEKSDRVSFVKKEGGFKQTTTGLYYKLIKAGSGSSILDTMKYYSSKGKTCKLKVYEAIYDLKGELLVNNLLGGLYEPIIYNTFDNRMKEGFKEAFSLMHEGEKMRFVMSTSLYGLGLPTLGFEPNFTKKYESIVCEFYIDDIIETEDPNLD
ncbi:hypothetical protein E0494_04340 [Marinilabiliaceae bacterium JC040]|nr:hypothetical protein [Marinilabiliaceae bacterium JC040]